MLSQPAHGLNQTRSEWQEIEIANMLALTAVFVDVRRKAATAPTTSHLSLPCTTTNIFPRLDDSSVGVYRDAGPARKSN
jgi:hypothetical protein